MRRYRAAVDDKGVLRRGSWCARVGRKFTLSNPLKRKHISATFPTHGGRIACSCEPGSGSRVDTRGDQWSSPLDPRSASVACGVVRPGGLRVASRWPMALSYPQRPCNGDEEPDLGWVMRHGAAPPERVD